MKATVFLLLLLTIHFGLKAQQADVRKSIERGQLIYSSNCVACHMANGEGLKGVFPPLIQTKTLNDLPALSKAIVNGVSGPISVKGTDYNGLMSGYPLSDEQVADLINYIRNSWGNNGKGVQPADIQPALKKN